jgi:hypothetical protein
MKRALPQSLSRPICTVFTAFLTPISFSLKTGHFPSSLSSKALDWQGNPIPRYSYAALDFLRARASNLLEEAYWSLAQGNLLWWARQADKVVSFAADVSANRSPPTPCIWWMTNCQSLRNSSLPARVWCHCCRRLESCHSRRQVLPNVEARRAVYPGRRRILGAREAIPSSTL